MTTLNPDRPDKWGNLLRVPAIPDDEINSDKELLHQMAEYIVSAVEMSTMTGGTILHQGGNKLVNDLVYVMLEAIYESSKK